jgi:hypothetical protein
MIGKFILQSRDQFDDALERIKATQEIEDSSTIVTFESFEETLKILFEMKNNFNSYENFFEINKNDDSKKINLK